MFEEIVIPPRLYAVFQTQRSVYPTEQEEELRKSILWNGFRVRSLSWKRELRYKSSGRWEKKEPEISGIVDAGKTKIIKKSPDFLSGDFFML